MLLPGGGGSGKTTLTAFDAPRSVPSLKTIRAVTVVSPGDEPVTQAVVLVDSGTMIDATAEFSTPQVTEIVSTQWDPTKGDRSTLLLSATATRSSSSGG